MAQLGLRPRAPSRFLAARGVPNRYQRKASSYPIRKSRSAFARYTRRLVFQFNEPNCMGAIGFQVRDFFFVLPPGAAWTLLQGRLVPSPISRNWKHKTDTGYQYGQCCGKPKRRESPARSVLAAHPNRRPGGQVVPAPGVAVPK